MYAQRDRTGQLTTDVLVVGAGPTGLTMANVLACGGARFRFRIVDKKDGPTEESRALVVHAKTLELFDKLGLADRAVQEGQRLGAARRSPVGVSSGFFINCIHDVILGACTLGTTRPGTPARDYKTVSPCASPRSLNHPKQRLRRSLS